MNKEEIIKLIEEKTSNTNTLDELNNLKVEFLGKKGIITEYQSMIFLLRGLSFEFLWMVR